MIVTEQDIQEWFRQNEEGLWLRNAKLEIAYGKACRDLRAMIPRKLFNTLLLKTCVLYKQLPRRLPSETVLLTKEQWEKLNEFAERNLLSLQGKDIDFVVAYLRAFRIPANRSIVRGSRILRPVVSDPERDQEERLPSWLV